MQTRSKKSIAFIQPSYAHYRDQLFSILSERHDIEFVYEQSFNVYPGEVTPGAIPHIFLDKKFKNAWFGLIYYLLKHQPSIVVSSVSTSFRSLVSYTYTRLFRKVFILWIEEWRQPAQSPRAMKRLWRTLKNLIGRKLIRTSHALVVGGSASRQYALSLGKDEADTFVAIQCANDLRPRQKMKPSRMKDSKTKYTFLYLSRIVPHKGLDILLKAFSLLRRKRVEAFLLIAGDGPFRSYCERLARSLEIPDISFVGAVDPASVVELYAKADLFVLPAFVGENVYESWGLVINEAMSMSLPIITTNAVGAAHDLVIDGYNGFVIGEKNTKDLYCAMEQIMDLDLVQMGMNSRILFDKKNDFFQMAKGFTSAIEHAKSKNKYYNKRYFFSKSKM